MSATYTGQRCVSPIEFQCPALRGWLDALWELDGWERSLVEHAQHAIGDAGGATMSADSGPDVDATLDAGLSPDADASAEIIDSAAISDSGPKADSGAEGPDDDVALPDGAD